MDDAELVGGVLVDTPDPRKAARQLAQLLVMPGSDRSVATRAGLNHELVQVLRVRFAGDPDRIAIACQEGAAWVLGRRSVVTAEPWDLVASLPSAAPLPPGLRRTTGETLMQLVVRAKSKLRLAAPFIDSPGLSFLSAALTAATLRGVQLEILLPTRSTHADDALCEFMGSVDLEGDPGNLQISRLRADAPWAHLKVMTSDSIAAYVGSANVTGAGIAGRNLELGVLVRGEQVRVIDHVLDMYREGGT
jgi:phosphatidylserine/phosphatidylglycerophosphate/cardiolipin synthase-like enzyme